MCFERCSDGSEDTEQIFFPESSWRDVNQHKMHEEIWGVPKMMVPPNHPF